MVVHFVYLLLVFFPHLVLILVFLIYIIYGAFQYKKRSSHPSHMNTKLSLIDSMHSEKLDEEFNTFPSSKNGEVLKKRDDRFSSIAGRVMTIIGNQATTQMLVQWSNSYLEDATWESLPHFDP